MRTVLLIALLIFTSTAYSQQLKFKISGQADTTIHLVKYFGKGLYYADTADIKGGVVTFDGSKQQPGILAVLLPGQKLFEFVYNNEEVYIETSFPNLMMASKVKKSDENRIFMDYVKFIGSERGKADQMTNQRKSMDSKSDEYKALTKQIDAVSEKVLNYQNDLIAKNPDKLVGKIVKMSMDIEVPDAPTDENGNITDSTFRFRYYREHYFDNIDFKDDRLVRTPIFHNKLQKYFSREMMIPHWDTVIYYAFDLCDQFDPKSDMFKYCVQWITSEYEKSKIMGMDKVFHAMGTRYFCNRDKDGNSMAHWMSEKQLDKLCNRVSEIKHTLLGIQPPNITLLDPNDKWRDFYSLDKEYTVLYFWDPQCGHCKKVTPKIQRLYTEKFRDRGIEVFAVGKAVGEDYEKWKKYIKDEKLDFINVGVTDSIYRIAMEDARQLVPKHTSLQSLNYQQTFDVYATPRLFVLDKDKKIIAKGLSAAQLEEFLDRQQGKEDLEKIFKVEEETEEDQVH